jgi:hypothetical protein
LEDDSSKLELPLNLKTSSKLGLDENRAHKSFFFFFSLFLNSLQPKKNTLANGKFKKNDG